MLLVAWCSRPDGSRYHPRSLKDVTRPDLRQRVNVVRSSVPAITHVDYSARIQTIDRVRNPRFHSGSWRPFAPGPAARCSSTRASTCEESRSAHPRRISLFLATEMDALVLENFVILKDGSRARWPTARLSRIPRAISARLIAIR